MKVLTIIGARPQFIKAAAVSRAFAKANIEEVIVHTGQHYDASMSDVFFQEMDIPKPHYNLDINHLGHGAMTGRMMEKIEEVALKEKPDFIVVYGDTNSTIAGALAGVKIHIPIAHVEAGLRSFNMRMPEEVNRILTDRISSVLFCPTDQAIENLKKEGFEHFNVRIVKTGDVMLDTLLYYQSKAASKSDIVNRLSLKGKQFILATIHRAENTDDPVRLRSIVTAINSIHQRTSVVIPLHPRTKAYLEKLAIKLECIVTEPLGYFDMLSLLSECRLVMTDSGGLQKESYFCSKYCVTLRDQTEWIELVEAGVNTLAGADEKAIVQAVDEGLKKTVGFQPTMYGDGHAADQIARALLD